MDILLTVILFLLGCCVGLLALIHVCRAREAERTIETMERIAGEQRTHSDAMATILVKEARILAQALLKEMQIAAKERRWLMDLVADSPERAPDSSEEPVSGPESDEQETGARWARWLQSATLERRMLSLMNM